MEPRTVDEIKARIEELEAGERYSYPPANVTVNAPLALIQVALKTEVGALKWAIGEVPEAGHH